MFSVRLPEKADELRSLVQQKRSSRKRKVSLDDTQLSSKRQVTSSRSLMLVGAFPNPFQISGR
jgi:hypothetical protein